jgi:hypothetical protein
MFFELVSKIDEKKIYGQKMTLELLMIFFEKKSTISTPKILFKKQSLIKKLIFFEKIKITKNSGKNSHY